MTFQLDFTTVAAIAVLVVAAHVALLISSRWVNVLMLVAATYFVVSPLSGATELPLVTPAKYGRIYCTLLIIVMGFFIARVHHLRPAGMAFIVFCLFYLAGSLWSDFPGDALKYKTMFFLVILAGLFTAYSIRDFRDLHVGMRLIGLACAAYIALIFLEIVRNPAAISHVGRLSAWGMNANRIGQTAAPMLTICAFLALYDASKSWKTFGYIVGFFMGVIIIYTGSRGAAGEAILGCFVVGIPLMRRPGLYAIILTVFVAAAYIGFTYTGASTSEVGERFFDTSLETRAGPWAEAKYYIEESVVFGSGWIDQPDATGGQTTRNLHSMYFQVLAETGVVGLALLAVVIVVIISRAVRARRVIKAAGRHVESFYLAAAFIAAILAHGLFEAGTVTGSLVNTMLLPFAIGLIDRMPELIAEEEHAFDAAEAVESDEALNPSDLPVPASA